jgi:radical SAM superfamily enzyme YgiQ (UPF0313 family)
MDRAQREWVLSRERGEFKVNPSARLTVGLVYPNSYAVGMSNLGYQTVAAIVSDHPDYRLERFFLPPLPGGGRRRGSPEILSLERGVKLGDVDIAAFSVSYENDYFGLASILYQSGIPIISAERRTGGWPVVLVGGVAPTLNPEPLADIADILLLGEAEETLNLFLDRFAESFGSRSRRRKTDVLGCLYSLHCPAPIRFGRFFCRL